MKLQFPCIKMGCEVKRIDVAYGLKANLKHSTQAEDKS